MSAGAYRRKAATRIPVTTQVHHLVSSTNLSGTCAIDATVGNGLDTVFLAGEVGSDGLVIGFDVQQQALAAATKKLRTKGLLGRVRLIHDSHDRLAHYLSLLERSYISACLFNLGYLPGSDKSVTTKPDTTIRALDTASAKLTPNGVISIVAYTGHVGGKEEADAVRDWADGLPKGEFAVMRPRAGLSSNSAPELTIIRRTDTRNACA